MTGCPPNLGPAPRLPPKDDRGLAHRASIALLVAGACLFVTLVWHAGFAALWRVLAPVGWGIIPTVLSHAVPLVIDVIGWRLLFADRAPAMLALVHARWVGEAINNLLPVAQIGGELARFRLARLAGADFGDAAAAVLADLTLGTIAQLVFAAAGIAMLVAFYDGSSVCTLLWGMLPLACGILAFYALQRRGFAALVGYVGRLFPSLAAVDRAEDLHRRLKRLYDDRRLVARAWSWRLLGWLAGVGEIALSLHFLGQEVSWSKAFILESLTQIVRSTAFAVPGALGVQEAGFVVVAHLTGADAAIGLAIALIRRGRDLGLGLPALADYWWIEARRTSEPGRS
jgi:putative membrane protein